MWPSRTRRPLLPMPARRRHELLLAHREHGGPAQPRVGRNRHQADGEQRVAQPGPHHRHDGDGQQRAGKRQQDVHGEHQRRRPSAPRDSRRSGRSAIPTSAATATALTASPSVTRVACSTRTSEIAPERVRAERVGQRGRLEPQRQVGVGLGVVVVNERRQHRHQDEHARRCRARPGPPGWRRAGATPRRRDRRSRGRVTGALAASTVAISAGVTARRGERAHEYLMRGSATA